MPLASPLLALALGLAAAPADLATDLPDAALAALLAEGDRLRSEGGFARAFETYARVVASTGDRTRKLAARDKLLALGPQAAPPIGETEKLIVLNRIRAEKERYLREVASRMYGQGHLRGARKLLLEVKGLVEEQFGEAVIGEVGRAERATKDVGEIEARILGATPPEERDEAAAFFDGAEKRSGKEILDRAEQLRKKRKLFAARRLLLHASFGDHPREILDRAQAELLSIESAILEDLSPEEKKTIEMASGHPVWNRLDTIASQRFIFIGDRDYIRRIPPASIHRLDVACVFLTDLFGRTPNPDGFRITIFFKELWRFAGGVGGGTIIDIGNADPPPLMEPDAKWVRDGTPIVDDGLFYHELTHCICDMDPVYTGFVEGLANLGAAYAIDTLHQKDDGWHSVAANLEAFRRDYVNRRVAYWRIQNYGPSAGFFLHFADKYSRGKDGSIDWSPFRILFRHHRETTWRSGRTTEKIRTIYRSLREAFGDAVLDDLRAFRFPLETGADSLVDREVNSIAPALGAALRTGDARALGRIADEYADSSLGRLARLEEARHLAQFLRTEEAREIARSSCGVLTSVRVCGPFYPKSGGGGLEEAFPPEDEIRFDARYATPFGDARWLEPSENGPVLAASWGRLDFRWSYPENAVTYALVFVDAPNAAPAHVLVGADDAVALWVNDRLVEKLEDRGGALLADHDRLEVPLREGRNKLLFKVANRGGPTALVARILAPSGEPIDGLKQDAGAPSDEGWRVAPVARRFDTVMRDDLSKGRPDSRLKPAAGEWKPGRGALFPSGRGGSVEWRKYTVRPGFPKDSPSHLLWLRGREKSGEKKDLRLEARYLLPRPGHPKLAITLDGEGGSDGLSGWTLIVHPSREGVAARLEEYDRLVYVAPDVAIPAAEEWSIVIDRVDGFVTLRMNDALVLRAVSTEPLDPPHVGFALWGTATGLASVALQTPRETAMAPVEPTGAGGGK